MLKYNAAGVERDTGRVIRNHSYPVGNIINDFASLPTSIPDHGVLYTRWRSLSQVLLGPGAPNEKKRKEEGSWSTEAIFMFSPFCTTTNTISLGEEKLRKARAYLQEPNFNLGNKEVTVHDLQVLLGRLDHCSVVVRPSQAYMAGLLRMISHGGPLIRPGFVEDDMEKAWARFWADLEALRLIFSDYTLITVSITAPFLTVLGPPERMRRAIEGDEFVVIGTYETE